MIILTSLVFFIPFISYMTAFRSPYAHGPNDIGFGSDDNHFTVSFIWMAAFVIYLFLINCVFCWAWESHTSLI